MLSVILALVIGVALGVLIAGVIASRRHRPVTESAGAPEATSSSENDVTLLLGEAVDNLEIGVVIAAPCGNHRVPQRHRGGVHRDTQRAPPGRAPLVALRPDARRRERPASRRPARPAAVVVGDRRRPAAERGCRGHHSRRERTDADRCDAHRLRHQRLPRVEDAGGSGCRPGRSADRRDRPGDRASARPSPRRRVAPSSADHRRPPRAVADRIHTTRRRGGRSDQRREECDRTRQDRRRWAWSEDQHARHARVALDPRRRAPTRVGRRQPGRECSQVQPPG